MKCSQDLWSRPELEVKATPGGGSGRVLMSVISQQRLVGRACCGLRLVVFLCVRRWTVELLRVCGLGARQGAGSGGTLAEQPCPATKWNTGVNHPDPLVLFKFSIY